MYLEYTLLALFLFFLMRIVFKRQGTYGLILPSIIPVVAGYHLFVVEPIENIMVGLVCVAFALVFRRVYHNAASAS